MTDTPHPITTEANDPLPELPLILLVDDEAEILVALEDLLEDDYRVIVSTSPVAALDMIDANPGIAVIVSDQRMPEMPGNQFLARARERTTAETILLTGYADLSAVISAVNDGAISGYANKPWEAEALRTMIAAAADRYRLRAELAFERAAFIGLSEGSDDAVSVIDRTHRTIRANRHAQASVGIPGTDAADEAALETGDYSEEECFATDAEGGNRWMRIRRIPFGSGDGRHLLKIESDETDRRIAANKLHQAEKLQALGTLAGGIAHDFNNLLAAILGNLELAARSTDRPDRLSRYLANATEAAGRGSAISRRLLSFSRQRDLAAQVFDPVAALVDIEEMIVRTMAGRVTLRLDLPDTRWLVRSDPGQFDLAVVNLCINARDAMPGGGEIVVSVANVPDASPAGAVHQGAFVRIAVADTGSGIAPALRERVFEPFFTTKPQGEGTGLGLPMVRAMAEAAGGTVTIDSEPDQGSTVAIWLPCAEGSVDPVEAAGGPQATGLRILIAEDDAEVRSVLVEHLAGAGHQSVEVASGDEAVRMLERDAAFDLLLTDYAMPQLSGLELASIVAARWPALPVLLVTGFAQIDEDEGAACVPVLTKPFTRDQLTRAITHAVARD